MLPSRASTSFHPLGVSFSLLLFLAVLVEEVELKLLAYDDTSDLALLRLVSKNRFECAKIIPKEHWQYMYRFAPVYLVSCPLGIDPFLTTGEIAIPFILLDGSIRMMTNAPAYFGSSGGGIFLESTLELIAIFSHIYTFRSTAVTHLNYSTPAPAIHTFLKEKGYGFIVDEEKKQETSIAESAKSRG